MANPIESQLGENFVNVYVWGAAPYIKKALLRDAEVGVTHESENGETRLLLHSSALRAATTLPWPLSKMQPHNIDLTVSDRNRQIIQSKTYSRSDIDNAITEFLGGLSSTDTVSINVG